jgi:hypothetical protein
MKPGAFDAGIFHNRSHLFAPCRAYFLHTFLDERESCDFNSLITGIAYNPTLFGPAQFRHAFIAHGVFETFPLGRSFFIRAAAKGQSTQGGTTQNAPGHLDEISATKV